MPGGQRWRRTTSLWLAHPTKYFVLSAKNYRCHPDASKTDHGGPRKSAEASGPPQRRFQVGGRPHANMDMGTSRLPSQSHLRLLISLRDCRPIGIMGSLSLPLSLSLSIPRGNLKGSRWGPAMPRARRGSGTCRLGGGSGRVNPPPAREHLWNIYGTSIEHLSNVYRISIENLSNIYRTSIDTPSSNPSPILLQPSSDPQHFRFLAPPGPHFLSPSLTGSTDPRPPVSPRLRETK